jgi:hypothetical protein
VLDACGPGVIRTGPCQARGLHALGRERVLKIKKTRAHVSRWLLKYRKGKGRACCRCCC